MQSHPTPLSRAHFAALLATWFGAGLLPKAPGTWGSVAALPFAWAMAAWGGGWTLLFASLLCFLVGWGASAIYVAETGGEDPSEVVIDEVAGQWLALSFAPPDPLLYAIGFALFRLFDVKKPGPIGWLDRNVGGGLGIMLDDMAAGLLALAVLALIRWGLP